MAKDRGGSSESRKLRIEGPETDNSSMRLRMTSGPSTIAPLFIKPDGISSGSKTLYIGDKRDVKAMKLRTEGPVPLDDPLGRAGKMSLFTKFVLNSTDSTENNACLIARRSGFFDVSPFSGDHSREQ